MILRLYNKINMPKPNIKNINYHTQNIILIISGTMASGKDTILRLLKKNIDLYVVKSTTSRSKRQNEKDNDPYNFISRDKFREMIKESPRFQKLVKINLEINKIKKNNGTDKN